LANIRVLLVDDHAIIRAGVRMVLEMQPDMQVVGEAEGGRDGVRLAGELKPDVVVMDLSMPDMDGFEATRQIKQRWPGMSVLALTMHDSEEYFFEVLKAGASGYVPKKAAPTDLVAAIRVVSSGGVFLFPTVAKSLVSDYLKRLESGGERAAYDGLTDRERQVLKLIAEGHSNQVIAEKLVISGKTVERHRANIMDKLNLHTRTDLVKYAIRKGLIDVE
jgi:two-component system, NarL family, response regulator NreC